MTHNIDLWQGWAALTVKQGSTVMPPFATNSAHRECRDPEASWAKLIHIEQMRYEMEQGGEMPKDHLGVQLLSYEMANMYLDRQANHYAAELAWGNFDEG